MRGTTTGAAGRRRPSPAVALVAALALAACSGGGDEPQAIEPTSEPTVEETDEPEPAPSDGAGTEDPYAIPDDIDVTYVQSVVDAVIAVPQQPLIEAYRSAPHSMPPQAVIDALRATRSPDEAANSFARYATQLSDAEASAEEAAFLESVELRWEVLDVEVARDDCVVIRFAYPEGADVPEGRAVLIRSVEGRDPGGLNPTPWLIDRAGSAESLTVEELEERCSVDQFADEDLDADAEGEA